MGKMISIITVNLNDCEGLRGTIDSVSKQEFRDYEHIIIDGGSSDGSLDLIKSQSEKFSSWVSEPDKGIYNAMNKGIGCARGKYCLFLNSGDYLHSEFTLSQCSKYLLGDFSYVVGNVMLYDRGIKKGIPHLDSDYSPVVLLKGSFFHQASFILRETLLKHPYDENFEIVSDWKHQLQTLLIDGLPFQIIPCIVSDFNVNGYSYLHPDINKREREAVLKSFFPPSILDILNPEKYILYSVINGGFLGKLISFLYKLKNR